MTPDYVTQFWTELSQGAADFLSTIEQAAEEIAEVMMATAESLQELLMVELIELEALADQDSPYGRYEFYRGSSGEGAFFIYEESLPFAGIGDLTCRYNARSLELRCAVNPGGPCEECKDYERDHNN